MQRRTLFALSTIFVLGLLLAALAWSASPDTNVVYDFKGTLGPVLSGTDPAGVNGKSGEVQVTMSEGAKPKSHTATSATYTIPKGNIAAIVNGNTYKSNAPATLKITLSTSADIVYVSGTFTYDGITATIGATASLASGAFPNSVLKHPAPFKSPQSLTAAKTASGAGSTAFYVFAGAKTVLGLSGTATD